MKKKREAVQKQAEELASGGEWRKDHQKHSEIAENTVIFVKKETEMR